MSNLPNIYIEQKRQTYACNLNQRIRQLCIEMPPQLAWAEPGICFYQHEGQLRAGRHPGFTPLAEGMPVWPDDLVLCEARLFWADHAVHLLAIDSANCAEVTLSEVSGEDTSTGKQVIRQAQTLLTLRDKERFGLKNIDLPDNPNVTAIEYRHQGRVLAWRLTLAATKGANSHV
ncbi:hypothetical protein [Methylobacter psychrophilus]|uniref:hypothetical protein n=1 Tax=Methylobacter psychrophilus TaxID=96941 RepID=UPI0021D518EA|nr:hypothetical protein [Methylobacter psychrophilus]